MTTLVTGDFHLTDNPRDAYRHKAMGTIQEIMRKHKVTRMILLGDLTEEKDRHSAELVNEVVGHIDDFAAICDLVYLPGNHDYKAEGHPFFQFISRIPGVRWISKPTADELPGLGKCMFLPHTRDWERDWEGMLDDGGIAASVDWVFAHNTFEGSQSEHGHVLKGIPTNIFGKGKDLVISGDIHTPQRVGPVTYVGAPYTVDFGDDYEPRVLILYDNDYDSVPVPGPQKRLIEVTSRTLERLEGADPDDIVKLKVKLDNGEYARWAEIRQAAKKTAEEAGLQVYSISPVVEKSAAKAAKRKTNPRLSDKAIFDAYVKARGIDAKTADVGLKLLED